MKIKQFKQYVRQHFALITYSIFGAVIINIMYGDLNSIGISVVMLGTMAYGMYIDFTHTIPIDNPRNVF